METMTVTFEGVGFAAKAVARYTEEQWVDWGMSRYFESKTEEVRMAILQQVYAICVQMVGAAPEAAITEEPAPVITQTKRTRKSK
jgi:hypothetical protein